MKIINLFTGYFLFLMIFNGIVLVTLDFTSFKKEGMIKTSIKSKYVGVWCIILGLILYFFKFIYFKFL